MGRNLMILSQVLASDYAWVVDGEKRGFELFGGAWGESDRGM